MVFINFVDQRTDVESYVSTKMRNIRRFTINQGEFVTGRMLYYITRRLDIFLFFFMFVCKKIRETTVRLNVNVYFATL